MSLGPGPSHLRISNIGFFYQVGVAAKGGPTYDSEKGVRWIASVFFARGVSLASRDWSRDLPRPLMNLIKITSGVPTTTLKVPIAYKQDLG